MSKENTRAHVAVLFTNIFFACNYSLVKFVSPAVIGPYGLNLARVLVSIVLFWLLWLFEGSPAGIQKKHLVRFLLAAVLGVTINQMLFVKGLTLTSTIHASLLSLCTPLLITLLAFWVLREKVTIFKAVGLALGIGGAILLIMAKESHGHASLRGDILIILNAIAYTFYFIMVKPLMDVYSPFHVMRWVFTFGTLMMLPFGAEQLAGAAWTQMEWTHIAALLFITIAGTFIAYSFNIYGIRQLGAGVTGSYIYTQPVLAAIIAAIFLHEEFTLQKIIAALLICAGVFLVSRKPAQTDLG